MGKIARIKNDTLYITGEVVESEKKEPLLYLDGVGTAITIPNTDNRFQPTVQTTWECWFKIDLTNHAQYDTLMGFGTNNWDIRMDGAQNFTGHWYGASGAWGTTIQLPSPYSLWDSEWHHIAIVWDGTNGKKYGYVDGVQTLNGSFTPENPRDLTSYNFANFTVGGAANGTARTTNAYMKEVRIWEVARTGQEIVDSMNIKLTGSETGLKFYLPLDEGDGSVIQDSASGWDVNLNSAEWIADNFEFRLTNSGDLILNKEMIETKLPSLNVNTVDTIINSYTAIKNSHSAGSTEISVSETGGFNIGDEVLLINMQGDYAGEYEFNKIKSVVLGLITLENPTKNSYNSGVFNSNTAQASQIITVPHYHDVIVDVGSSIVAKHWDGYTGGIVVFKADGEVLINGSIDVSESGFRGGEQQINPTTIGNQGESYKGLGLSATTDNNYGGGGGGYLNGSYWGLDGGGGGFGTNGSNGIIVTHGGILYGANNFSNIFIGSGGGSGARSSYSGERYGGYGGAGSGSVIILSPKITVNGRIYAIGQDGQDGYPTGSGGSNGGGGGGSGGGIYLQTNNLVNNGIISNSGGAVGDSIGDTGESGNGGSGRNIEEAYADKIVFFRLYAPDGKTHIIPEQTNNLTIGEIVENTLL